MDMKTRKERAMRGRVKTMVMGALMIGLLSVPTVRAEREGSGTYEEKREGSGMHEEMMREDSGSSAHEQAMPFQEGEHVTLRGRLEGAWLVVTEGPHAEHQFELSKNRTLEQLQQRAAAGQTYEVSGQALEQDGRNVIALESYRPVEPGSKPSTSPSYREGS
jgi:hypothetical protein